MDSPRSRAASRIASAIMCSESPSAAAISANTSSSSRPSAVATSTTPCSPLVSVPVLSKTTTLRLRASSIAILSRTRMPLFAAIEVLIATTRGTASPSAWGQAITSTVTTRSTTGSPKPTAAVHATAVIAATPSAA
jgi:hypothetical protein